MNPTIESLNASRAPCAFCSTLDFLSDLKLCASCHQEQRILTHRQNTGKPVYLLTESLSYHEVTSITCRAGYYEVTVPGISAHYCVQLEDFHLSIPSLVTTGIARANDSILRFNSLHKQHLALS